MASLAPDRPPDALAGEQQSPSFDTLLMSRRLVPARARRRRTEHL